jgi:hypothetical protein
MNDQGNAFVAGRTVGIILRGLLLGLLLSTAVVGVIGHDSTTKVFRYEGF